MDGNARRLMDEFRNELAPGEHVYAMIDDPRMTHDGHQDAYEIYKGLDGQMGYNKEHVDHTWR